MKKSYMMMIGIVLAGMLTGCGVSSGNSSKVVMENNVDKVLKEQMNYAQSETGEKEVESVEEETDSEEELSETTENGEMQDSDTVESQDVDFDLTTMSSDMVYATVYQFMVYPNQYEGCTVRMKGNYYATFYELTQKYYHYVIIQDAMACCAQGMEFIWKDGTHKYPEEYPEDNAEVEVTGVFTSYREEGDDNLYCALKDAELKVLD